MDTTKSWSEVQVESASDGPADAALLARAAQLFGWELQLAPALDPNRVSAQLRRTDSSLRGNLSELIVLLAVAENVTPQDIIRRIPDDLRGLGLNVKQNPRRMLGDMRR
ncbi:hypothetical protein ACWCOV_06610 [Kribbella sp. NPDC002412]